MRASLMLLLLLTVVVSSVSVTGIASDKPVILRDPFTPFRSFAVIPRQASWVWRCSHTGFQLVR